VNGNATTSLKSPSRFQSLMRSPRRPGSGTGNGTGSGTGPTTESHAATLPTTGVLTAVLRIRDTVPFLTPGSGMGKKS
jgi:hypothetical protein